MSHKNKEMIKTILKRIKYGKLYEDVVYAQNRFKNTFGYALDLKNPKTFNEKLQWLKLYDRTDLHTPCADKLLVRDYVKKTIGEKYLIPLVLVTNKPKDINIDKLPNYPVIAKTNHDCGSYHIIKNKELHDWDKTQNELKNSLKRNYYDLGKEWQYKNITPTIIVEKLLIDKKDKIATDYKFFCFNGKVSFIQLDFDKETSPTRNFYDTKWELLDFQLFETPISKMKVIPPDNLHEMITLAEKLGSPFLFTRVDFYLLNEKIFFGEITFHPSNGFAPFSPIEWDRKFGDLIKLPI